jgi:integrase/recombinase XerD
VVKLIQPPGSADGRCGELQTVVRHVVGEAFRFGGAATGVLLSGYLAHRARVSRARGPLFLSESRRNHGEPLSLWSWSKVVRRVALAADVPRFSTHTTRHLCLTDLARMGWELHAIATFAGHRSTESTLTYIHLSGRELSAKLNRSMTHLHAQRISMLGGIQLTPPA